MTCEILKTKFGNAKIGFLGYYQITSKKEGNHEAKGLLWKKLDGGKEWQEPTDLKIRY